jgi:hypothetical protein
MIQSENCNALMNSSLQHKNTSVVFSHKHNTNKTSTNLVEQQSPEQEFPSLLWKPKVHYCIQKGLRMDGILSQMNSVHNFLLCFFKLYLNVISVRTVSVQFRFSYQNCPTYLVLPDLIMLIIF